MYTLTNIDKINWLAKSDNAILQNVSNLLRTYTYDIPYARTVGIDPSFIDLPEDEAIPMMQNNIIEEISLREPRVSVLEVNITRTEQSGQLYIEVVVEIE